MTNLADGNATVGVQAGYVHGDVYYFQPPPNATPEQKLQVAIRYLDGGAPGEARRRFRALVAEDGLSSAELAYYWMLSLLSGRSLSSLGGADQDELAEAFGMAERYPTGRWWRCADTIRALVNAMLDVGPDGRPAMEALGAALHAYESLPDVDRYDIERHLSLALSGVAQDHVEKLNAAHVREMRPRPDRLARVPKFFEPDPAEPVAKTARPAPAESTFLPLAGGCLLTAAGVGLLVQAAAATSALAGVAVFLLVAAGGYAIVRHGLERAFLRARQAAKEAELATGARSAFRAPGGDSMRPGFADAITAMIESAFAGHQPREEQLRDAFWRDTHGLRTALHGDMIDLYGVRGVRADAVRWLVHHHADDIACRWRDGSLDDFRRRYRPAALPPVFLAGIAALAAAVLVVLLSMSFCSLAVAAPLLYFGVRLAHRGGIAVYGERRRIALDTDEFEQRWAAECAAYHRWAEWLADRPTDAEMGRWLSLDLAYFKREVMEDYRLANRDILAHLALTEAAPRSRSARFVGGPFRHSAYTVVLFLLTESGVRQVQARLDFATGAFSGEKRTTFRYDAIGSVQVTEVGRRFVDVRSRTQKVVTRQALRLALVNGQTFDVLLDDFAEDSIDHVLEDADQLARLASDAAGVTSALHILEAVAADGREWIALERRRLHRRVPRRRSAAPAVYPPLPG